MTGPPTLGAFARDISRQLQQAGISPDEARLDAELLVRSVLDWDRAAWLCGARDSPPPGFTDTVGPLVARRQSREPMAYILGRCEFWGLALEVSPAVLIPRPESELLVEHALARIGPDDQPLVVDVGTGSGCLAIAIARERPRARLVATDVSSAALDVARRNARRHDVGDRIEFRHGAWLAGMAAADVIVSNPPYVPDGDRTTLQPEVREHEPADALFAGPDGLDAIRTLVDLAARCLRPAGWVILEFGFGQSAAVRALVDADPRWKDVQVMADLQGIPRTLVVRRGLG